MNSTHTTCPECGADWTGGTTCQDCFEQMLVMEHERPEPNYSVHHLMVLCFYLQHPSRYSPDGLRYGKTLLVDFIARGISPQEIRRRNQDSVDSSRRKWEVTGTSESHGAYGRLIHWKMTAEDVCAGGIDAYVANIRSWARSTYESLREAGELTGEDLK